ncbi:MAG TPA: hypothetical protein VLH39_04895 [Magnetospirillaceae bacterium]|nr:hypothetical protein [Magnetospirillaceae bacterium]
MAPLKEELRKALSVALDKRRRDDTPETAIGREVRRAGLRYQDYLDVMEAVRVKARKERTDAWKAARALLDEE